MHPLITRRQADTGPLITALSWNPPMTEEEKAPAVDPAPAMVTEHELRNNSHRGRGEEAIRKRREDYAHNGVYERGREKIKHLTEERILDVPFPDHFVSWSKSGKKVTELVAKHWPTPPNELPAITTDDRLTLLIKARDPTPEQLKEMGPGGVGRWLVRNSQGKEVEVLSAKEVQALEDDGLPYWLAMRLAHIIPIPILDELLARWDHLIRMGLKFPKPDPNRSRTAAVHLGVWGLFGTCPRITADSLQKDISDPVQRALVLEAMDAMLQHLKAKIITKITPALDELIPEHVRLQDRLRAHAERLLRKEFAARPALNFGGLFFTIAIKEGSSERIHIDWNDCLQKYALIFCAGDYTGGDFCIPQLKIRIPLRPGSVLAVRTRLLAHCATEWCREILDCEQKGDLIQGRGSGKARGRNGGGAVETQQLILTEQCIVTDETLLKQLVTVNRIFRATLQPLLFRNVNLRCITEAIEFLQIIQGSAHLTTALRVLQISFDLDPQSFALAGMDDGEDEGSIDPGGDNKLDTRAPLALLEEFWYLWHTAQPCLEVLKTLTIHNMQSKIP
ncbi:hypothetical protein C8R46DRAFT_1029328 [Mycena filopes]|nr:hypothetical protein C8R46DRAFT_1029328 [Mycena filopes]